MYESNPLCWGGSRLIVTHRVGSRAARAGHSVDWTLSISLIGLNTGTTSAYISCGRRREGSASSMNGDGRIRDPILLWFDFCKFWFPHKICMNFYTEVKTGHKHHNHHQHGLSWATETKRWKIPKYIEIAFVWLMDHLTAQ